MTDTPGLKRKRYSYEASFKLKVINFAEANGNRAASREFTIPQANVRLWRKQKELLVELPQTKRACRGLPAKYPDLEKELVEWVTDQRCRGYIVTMLHIQLEALRRKRDPGFKASLNWVHRFMKRNGLSLRQKTKIAQKLPSELADKVISFHSYVLKQRKLHDFELSQIGNMDETPLCFDMLGRRTIEPKGSRTVQIRTTGHEKTHFTTVLTCMADGTKLKPMVIFKRKTAPKEKFPAGVVIHVHPKGWMDEEGIVLWLNQVWNSRPGALLKKKSLLVWDQFRAHMTNKVKGKCASINTTQAVIPGGLTSILQPLDVVLNKPFKDRMRQKWMAWMASGQQEQTKSGNFKRPSLSLVSTWVKEAWDDIPSQMVAKAFLKTGISNRMDGTEDDELWKEDTEEEETEDEDQADPNWDTDERLTPEEFHELFGDTDDDFDGF